MQTYPIQEQSQEFSVPDINFLKFLINAVRLPPTNMEIYWTIKEKKVVQTAELLRLFSSACVYRV
jgi:hypothetical protein